MIPNEGEDTDGSNQTASQCSETTRFTTCNLEGSRNALCNQGHMQEQQLAVPQRLTEDAAATTSDIHHNKRVLYDTWNPVFLPSWTVGDHLHSLRNFKGKIDIEYSHVAVKNVSLF